VRVDRLLQAMPVVGAEGAMEPVPEPERRNPSVRRQPRRLARVGANRTATGVLDFGTL
jgi:hypothetical protein